MSEELDNNIGDDQVADFDTRKKKQGQMLLVLFVAMVLIVGGLVYFTNTMGKKEKKENTSDLENMMPPEAKNKPTKLTEKYGRDYNRKLSDETYDSGLSELTETQPVFKKRSNEDLTDEDYNEVAKASSGASLAGGSRRKPVNTKAELNKANQRQIKNAQAQISYHADPDTPMFQKSAEELREERLAELERENNAALTRQVLEGLERASQAQNQPAAAAAAPTGTFASAPPNSTARKKVNNSGLKNNTAENTIARATDTGFYSQSTVLEENALDQFSYIPAVVHGNGDGIRVQNGSSIKLRLLSETFLMVGGRKKVLPRSTLINGTVRINGDRVNITITAIRIDNNLVPVQMLAYDIDGSQGLYIPNLMDKNLLARELTEAGSRPMQGSIWTQGNFAQQVGTQLATESARSLMQGASQYARRKMNQVRVTIKPNYKVLLTTGSLENSEYTESITNY